MAYSRWAQSRWFVFGTSQSDTPKEKRELSIHDSGGMIFDYSFLELEEGLQAILDLIERETKASGEEISELAGYISSFLHEVDDS